MGKMKAKATDLVEDIAFYDNLIGEGGTEIELAFYKEQRDSALSELRSLNGLAYFREKPTLNLKVVR